MGLQIEWFLHRKTKMGYYSKARRTCSWNLKSTRGEWKNKITTMYGYRADPFTGEKKFHTAIDIADIEGTPLLAVFDGVITYTEHSDSGYGNYVELTDKEGNRPSVGIPEIFPEISILVFNIKG